MDDTVKQDMDKSAAAFKNLVWPIVLPVIGGGDLLQMENVKDSNFAKILDIKAGIDGWQIHRDGMRGIASRIQQGEKAWNTFIHLFWNYLAEKNEKIGPCGEI